MTFWKMVCMVTDTSFFSMGVNMIVALYIRVSTQEQAREGVSLAAQESLLKEYCSMLKYDIYRVYMDDGYSAKNMNRPALKVMIEDMKNHQFDSIMVWKLSRISRSVFDLLTLLKEFDKYGVKFVSYSEQFDTNTTVGKLLLTVLASVAEFERETIADNVKTALTYRANLGKPTATQVLGYLRHEEILTIIPTEAKLVQEIFREYLDCYNYSEVARRMNKKGYRGKRGKPFGCCQIKIIITNPIYIGINRWDKKEIMSYHEKIISEELFKKANHMSC